jgi:flagellar biosynthetic protein FliQ
MTMEVVVQMTRNALLTALLVSAPILVAALFVGLIISIFQAITQIHEMTLTFIPKILTVVAVLLLLLPWILQVMVNFTVATLQTMNQYLEGGIRF